APPGVVEEGAGEAVPPGLEDGHERAAVEVWAQPVLEQVDDPQAGDCRVDREAGGAADADEKRPRRVDPDHLAIARELPGRRDAAGKAAPKAGMAEQLARVRRAAAALEVVGRGGGGEALHAGTDRDGDHVLLQPLLVADAGIAPGRDDVDKAFLRDHLEPDL